MKNKINIIVIFLVLFIFVSSSSKPLFSYPNFSQSNLEEVNGNRLWLPESYMNMNYREKIRTVSISVIKNNKMNLIKKMNFDNGLLASVYTSPNDTGKPDVYLYDDQRKLVKNGVFSYSYDVENKEGKLQTRIRYYENTLQQKETIEIVDNGYNIIIENNSTIHRTEFKINDGHVYKLKEIMNGKFMYGYDFLYNDDFLYQIIHYGKNGPSDIRIVYTVLLNEGNNILLMDIDYVNENIDRWVFSGYDEYGNWHEAEQYNKKDNSLIKKYHRDFEYLSECKK